MGAGGKGGGGGSIPMTPDTSYREDAGAENRRALEEMRRQMEEQQRQFQEAMAEILEQQEEARRSAEEAAAQSRRESAYGDIETLFNARLEAEETAIASVDQELQDEQALADLRGVDYQITEEQRTERIQNKFEEFWDVRYESELSNLLSTYGGPEMSEEQRKLVEQGVSEYFWDPQTKYSGFEYPEAPEGVAGERKERGPTPIPGPEQAGRPAGGKSSRRERPRPISGEGRTAPIAGMRPTAVKPLAGPEDERMSLLGANPGESSLL